MGGLWISLKDRDVSLAKAVACATSDVFHELTKHSNSAQDLGELVLLQLLGQKCPKTYIIYPIPELG